MPVPRLKEFAPRFERTIEMQCGEKLRTVEFYKQKLATLMADERLVSRRIDSIDEAAIEDYVQRRGKVESRRGAPLSAGSIKTASWRRCAACCVSPTSGRKFSAFLAYVSFEASIAANRQ